MLKMTSMQLKDHLSSESKFRSYDGNLENLLFGCELEYLIQPSNNAKGIFRKTNIESLFNELVRTKHYTKKHAGFEQRISKETKSGFICIKPDFAYHVLELSLPPRNSPAELKELIKVTLEEVDEALDKFNFKRSRNSIVDEKSFEYEMIDLDRHHQYLDFFKNKPLEARSLYFPDYPARVAALQIHLNIGGPKVFELLPGIYELEWIAADLFSRSTTFQGIKYGCARNAIIDNTLGAKYALKTIPTQIPRSANEYSALFNKTPHIFPNDVFFPAKDYTFVRPRHYRTLEFRSTCTQSSAEEILKVCAFRVLQVANSVKNSANLSDGSGLESRKSWLNKIGPSPQSSLNAFEEATISRAKSAWEEIPNKWKPYLEEAMAAVIAA